MDRTGRVPITTGLIDCVVVINGGDLVGMKAWCTLLVTRLVASSLVTRATLLLCRKIMWLVKVVVLALRAITIMSEFELVSLCSIRSISLSPVALSVLAGLLVNIIVGCTSSVWYRVMCRRLLLDRVSIAAPVSR